MVTVRFGGLFWFHLSRLECLQTLAILRGNYSACHLTRAFHVAKQLSGLGICALACTGEGVGVATTMRVHSSCYGASGGQSMVREHRLHRQVQKIIERALRFARASRVLKA